MEYTVFLPATRTAPKWLSSKVDPAGLSAWTLAFGLIAYLALRDGGYDTIVRSEVGVAIWWIVLLTALAGFLPGRIGRGGWVLIGLLAAFAAWTGLAVGWSQNAESSVIELGREATYLGFLVLAVALQGRTAARHTVNGLACSIGFVTVLSVLSRFHPQAFPVDAQFQFLGATAGRRLSYPLNYWNGLAAFAAIGVPLLLATAAGARSLVGKALSAATLPLGAVCIYLTISRGGVLELCVGVAVFLLLVPRRVEVLGTLLISGAGAAILLLAVSRHGALRGGLRTPVALHQGTEMLLLAIIVCSGVALLQTAQALAIRHLGVTAGLRSDRRRTARRALAAAAVAIVVSIGAGLPGQLAHQWHNFAAPPGVVTPVSGATVFSRLSAVNGNGRYQYWQAALHANATNPWLGIGAGTFRFWWASHATTDGAVLNAHSLYFETLAETGIIGLALIGGLLLWVLGSAVRRSVRISPETDVRIWIAAAGGGIAAFSAAAAIDWVWQLGAVAAVALLLAAVIVAGRDDGLGRAATPEASPRAPRVVLALLACVSLIAIAVPLAGALEIRRSQDAAAAGDLRLAYRDALAAQRLQPYAATPRLQAALVLEASGRFGPAAQAAEMATSRAPTDWQTWLTLARIDARRGADGAALRALRRARSLDPRSTLFEPA